MKHDTQNKFIVVLLPYNWQIVFKEYIHSTTYHLILSF